MNPEFPTYFSVPYESEPICKVSSVDESKDKDWRYVKVSDRPCFCGLDKAGCGGRHSDYCPKSQPFVDLFDPFKNTAPIFI